MSHPLDWELVLYTTACLLFLVVRGMRQWQWWSGLLGQYAHDMVGGVGLITHMCQLADNGDTPIMMLDEVFP
jgi:hypothetical protein